VSDLRPRIAVITFPGSNDDQDALLALDQLGANPVPVWHADKRLPDVAAVVLPGGFSYGDYLRCGAIARFSPAVKALAEFAAQGGLVLGICNGFQILCEAGLLPGALRPNASLAFICRDVVLRVERTDTPFTAACSAGQRLTMPIKHGEGSWFVDSDLLAQVQVSGQVVLRYEDNPNGSVGAVAAVRNEGGNVMGLMPHPEHAVDPLLGSTDGALILGSVVEAAREASRLPAATSAG
jgi:phosphoribosylformylglycinamidine synthase subunit PurQ / glutaminase